MIRGGGERERERERESWKAVEAGVELSEAVDARKVNKRLARGSKE
jgi:hypothetical protein